MPGPSLRIAPPESTSVSGDYQAVADAVAALDAVARHLETHLDLDALLAMSR